MIDEWGEEINNIQDQGVFNETSLGSTEAAPQAPQPPVMAPGAAMQSGFPNTMPTQPLYAPTPEKVIHQVAPNRYGLYQGAQGPGPQVQAAFPEPPIHPAQQGPLGMGCPQPAQIAQATAGMGALGTDYGPSLEDLGITGAEQRQFGVDPNTGWGTGDPAWDQPASGGTTFGEGLGYATDILGSVMGAVGQGFGIANQYQQGQIQRQQATAMFEQQMATLNMRREEAQASGQMDRYMQLTTLRSRLEQANAAAGSGSPADMAALLAVLRESQSATSSTSTILLVVGGVVVVGLGGLAIWALTRDKD
jgi:hypothetical protein